jgi:hypothetical protein
VVAAHPSQCNLGIASGGFNAGTDAEYPPVQARRPRAALTRISR